MSGGVRPWPTVATAAVLGGAAAYLLTMSTEIAEQARLYPQIFLVATLVGSVALAIQALVQARRVRTGGARAAAGVGDADVAEDPDRPGWPLYPVLVLYALVLQPLGFVVSTLLFLTSVLLWLRVPARRSIPLALAGVLLIFVVFRTAMYVSLPAGPVDIYLLELIYSR